jgi:hypothetical protein
MKLGLISWRDMVNPKKWASFVFGTLFQKLVPLHIAEILLYRSQMCFHCTGLGYCTKCGCTMPDKAYVPWEQCGDKFDPKWGPLPFWGGKKHWEEYKRKFNVTITITENP